MNKAGCASRRAAILLACSAVMSVAVVPASANPDPPAWSAFLDAAFTGIDLSPSLETGVLHYTLSLDSHPTITVSETTYDVNWVQSFFLVAENQWEDFVATKGTVVTDWFWESKPQPGRIAGWVGSGNTRVYPSGSKLLGFLSLDTMGVSVLSGVHVGYQTQSGEFTAWYRDSLDHGGPDEIPEPGCLFVLFAGAVGLGLRRLG